VPSSPVLVVMVLRRTMSVSPEHESDQETQDGHSLQPDPPAHHALGEGSILIAPPRHGKQSGHQRAEDSQQRQCNKDEERQRHGLRI